MSQHVKPAIERDCFFCLFVCFFTKTVSQFRKKVETFQFKMETFNLYSHSRVWQETRAPEEKPHRRRRKNMWTPHRKDQSWTSGSSFEATVLTTVPTCHSHSSVLISHSVSRFPSGAIHQCSCSISLKVWLQLPIKGLTRVANTV